MKLTILLNLFLLFSCATGEKVKVGTVNIKNGDDQNIKINTEENNIEYGPVAGDLSQSQQISNSQNKLVGLHLGPGAYSTINYIGLIKNLKSKEIKVGVVSGDGLGALLAVLYAKYDNPDIIEWKIFNLISELKKSRFLNSNWRESYKRFLEKEFKNEKIQTLKKVAFIPVYDSKTKKIMLLKSGKIKDALLAALRFHGERHLSPMVIGKNNFNVEHKSLGVDVIINSFLLSNKSKMTQVDGLNWGIYARNFKSITNSESKWDLKLGKDIIDKLDNNSNLVYHGEKQSKLFVEQLKLYLSDESKD